MNVLDELKKLAEEQPTVKPVEKPKPVVIQPELKPVVIQPKPVIKPEPALPIVKSELFGGLTCEEWIANAKKEDAIRLENYRIEEAKQAALIELERKAKEPKYFKRTRAIIDNIKSFVMTGKTACN